MQKYKEEKKKNSYWFCTEVPHVRLVKNFDLNLMSVSVYVNLFIGHYECQETNAKFIRMKRTKKLGSNLYEKPPRSDRSRILT